MNLKSYGVNVMLTDNKVIALTEEAEQQEAYKAARPNLVRALHDLNSTIHWLHETGDWESEAVDEAFRNLEDARHILKDIVG